MGTTSNQPPYIVVPPRANRIPILISVPHCGNEIPAEIANSIKEEFRTTQPDTDWLVHDLYSFAAEIGATLVHARFSRYVIDLNRDPDGGALYSDGRKETTLIPKVTFAGETICSGPSPDAAETTRRLREYYTPYYDFLEHTLAEMRRSHQNVIFLDAHSIKRLVESISVNPFPDLILGSKDGSSADKRLVQTALDCLAAGNQYGVTHNTPFKGGHLTRHFGRPAEGIHALQLEMAQDIYLAEKPFRLHPEKAPRIQALLRAMIERLAVALKDLP